MWSRSIAGRCVFSLAVTALAVVLPACVRRSVAIAPTSGVALVALLRDPDNGTAGRVTVSNQAGAVELSGPLESTRVVAGERPAAVVTMDGAELQRIFGEALAALPPAPRHFTLFFQFESEELTEDSRRSVPEILQAAAQRPAPDVIAIGHTDTTGNATTNYELGIRRAKIVQMLLTAAGLAPAVIEIASHGEANPLVQTPDNTYEPRNRRVEIEIK